MPERFKLGRHSAERCMPFKPFHHAGDMIESLIATVDKVLRDEETREWIADEVEIAVLIARCNMCAEPGTVAAA